VEDDTATEPWPWLLVAAERVWLWLLAASLPRMESVMRKGEPAGECGGSAVALGLRGIAGWLEGRMRGAREVVLEVGEGA
jgi:hypothetical protein